MFENYKVVFLETSTTKIYLNKQTKHVYGCTERKVFYLNIYLVCVLLKCMQIIIV